MAYFETRRAAAERRRALTAEQKRSPQHRVAGHTAMAALTIAIGALLFWLAYKAVGEPAVALIIVLLMLLPVASLAAASASGQPRR